jgi:hypothetical protein
MICDCRGRHLCDYHQAIEQERAAAVSRVFNNKLTALARKFDAELSNDQWCKLMYLYEADDLHLLLEKAGS